MTWSVPGARPRPEVDAPGMQRLEGGVLLGDDQRGVVGEHDPAGSHPQGGGGVGQVADEHGRGRTGHGRHPVVLGHPHPPVAEPFDHRGQAGGVGQGVGRGRALGHRGQVEHGQRHHGGCNTAGSGDLPPTGRAVDQGRSGRRWPSARPAGPATARGGPGGPDDHGVSEERTAGGPRRCPSSRGPGCHPRPAPARSARCGRPGTARGTRRGWPARRSDGPPRTRSPC